MNNSHTPFGQYLSFMLGREMFALDIEKIREVLELKTISQIPRTPRFVRGVIDLRGHAVPVIDMRRKLNMADKKDTIETCIIIMEVMCGQEKLNIGVLVDSVRKAFEMDAKDIEPAPRIGAAISTDYIKGMGRQDESFIIVDIDAIFSDGQFKTTFDTTRHREEIAA